MYEHILALILSDEPKAPPIVEPYNISTGHNVSFNDQRRGARCTKEKA
jgi:hypothetical protein